MTYTLHHGELVATHWGTYRAECKNGRLISLQPFEADEDPSPIANGLIDTLDDRCRIGSPMVRRSFLKSGIHADRSRRGAESFVSVPWKDALDLTAQVLRRTRGQYGNEAIYAGSYGWASAGRFHHAQSQLKRFLNLFGGCTGSVNSYSYAAAEVILPRILGNFSTLLRHHTSWTSIASEGQLVVAFGGLPLKNSQVSAGGTAQHVQKVGMRAAKAAGIRFVNISPIRSDTADFLGADWVSIWPNTDVALMLALAHTLVAENLYDSDFLKRYTVGFSRFMPYLMGDADRQPKSAEWASTVTGVDAATIRRLARDIAGSRTTICN